MIKSLQAWRGIAAILIFYHHYGFDSDIFVSFGDFGVVFFMVLSGFVTYLSAERKYSAGKPMQSIGRFMGERLSKIYPLYLVCWIAGIVILPYAGSTLGKLLGGVALQSWIPDVSVFFAGNGVSWFISDLFFCYLMFLPTFRLLHQHSGLSTAVIGLFFGAYFAVALFIPEDWVLGIVYINPVMQLANFIIGMLLCRWFCESPQLWDVKWAWIFQAGAIILIVIFMVFYSTISPRFSFGSYWWLPVALCIAIFAKTDFALGAINQTFHSRPAMLAGNLSFSFYLIHGIGICVWTSFFDFCGLQTDNVLIRIVQSVALVILLFVISYFVEQYFIIKVQTRLKKLLK